MLRQGRHCLTAVQVCVLDMDHAADVQQLRYQGFEACYIGLACESSQGMLQSIATALQHQPLPGYEHEDAAQQLLKVVTASCTICPFPCLPAASRIAERGIMSELCCLSEHMSLLGLAISSGLSSSAMQSRLGMMLHCCCCLSSDA